MEAMAASRSRSGMGFPLPMCWRWGARILVVMVKDSVEGDALAAEIGRNNSTRFDLRQARLRMHDASDLASRRKTSPSLMV